MLFFDQPAYDPFWAEAEKLSTLVYIHPRVSLPSFINHLHLS
jgi:hypothetical protein